MMRIFVILFLLVIYSYKCFSTRNRVFSQKFNFSLQSSRILYQVNNYTGISNIFLSSIDQIIRLDPQDLSNIYRIETGPRNFSLFCEENQDCSHCSVITLDYPTGYSAEFCGPRLTHNYLKAWNTLNPFHHSIHGFSSRVYTGFHIYSCFSLYHGFCVKIHMDKFSNAPGVPYSIFDELDRMIPIVGWNPSGSAQIFVDNQYLIIIHEKDHYESLNLLETSSYTIRDHNFQYKSNDKQYSDLIIKSTPPEIDYLCTFKARSVKGVDFVYISHRENVPKRNKAIVKLSRICSGDMKFFSYVSIDGFSSHHGYNFDNITHSIHGRTGQILGKHLSDNPHFKDSILDNTRKMDNHYLDVMITSVKLRKSKMSALFLTVIDEANIAFDRTMFNCFQGNGTRGPEYFFPNIPLECQTDILPSDISCPNKRPLNRLVSSRKKVDQSFPLHLIDEIEGDITGLSISTSPDALFTLLYMTLNNGSLIKYEIIGNQQRLGKHLETIDLTSGSRKKANALQHLQTDMTSTFGYTLSKQENSLIRIELSECERFTDCIECITSQDPLCGWCISNGKCTRVDKCLHPEGSFNPNKIYSIDDVIHFAQDNHNIKNYTWLSRLRTRDECPKVELVQPKGISLTGEEVKMNFLFKPDDLLMGTLRLWKYSLSCIYRNRYVDWKFTTHASFDEGTNSLTCNGPSSKSLSLANETLAKEDLDFHLAVKNMTENSEEYRVLGTGRVPFYDCSRLNSCLACVSIQFGCDWCLQLNRCIDQHYSTNCPRISNIPSIKSLITTNNIDECPLFRGAEDNSRRIFSGSPVSLEFSIQNVPSITSTYYCEEDCSYSLVIGRKVNNQIHCHFPEITIPKDSRQGLLKCEIRLYWSLFNLSQDRFRIEPLEKSLIEVFDCERMATFCDDCLSLAEYYGCGYCQTQDGHSDVYHGKCTREENCLKTNDSLAISDVYNVKDLGDRWIIHGQICPNPRITNVTPRNTTKLSNTLVTIEGHNLGRTLEDINSIDFIIRESPLADSQSILTLATCNIASSGFISSRQIQCVLKFSDTDLLKHQSDILYGQFRIIIGPALYPAVWEWMHILVPRITSFYPKLGPIAGGTRVVFKGTSLKVGRKVELLLGNRYCIIEILEDDVLVCYTEPFLSESELSNEIQMTNIDRQVKLKLIIDDMLIEQSGNLEMFRYKTNPIIDSVEGDEIMKSGGTEMIFQGRFLDVIDMPKLIIYFDNAEITSPCTIIHDWQYICPIPKLKDRLSEITDSIEYGLLLDRVEYVRRYDYLKIYDDPKVHEFDAETYREEIVTPMQTTMKMNKSLVNHIVRIFGDFPKIKKLEEITRVDIGNVPCEIQNLLHNEIRCSLFLQFDDKESPALKDVLLFDISYPVSVKFGNYVHFSPGQIRFKYQSRFISKILPIILIVTGCVSVVLIVFIFVSIIATKKYSKKTYLKNAIEKVLAEQQEETNRNLKEGFAAIQNACVKSISIPGKMTPPVRSYEWFAVFTLFPELHKELTFPIDPIVYQNNPNSLNYLKALARTKEDNYPLHIGYALDMLYETLMDAQFCNYIINILDQTLFVREKSHAASMIAAILHDDMAYYTGIMIDQIYGLCHSLNEYDAVTSFRSAENVVVKMIANWLMLISYDHLKENVSKPLYELYHAFKEMIHSEAQDDVTGSCVSSLNLDKMLKCNLTPTSFQVTINFLEQLENGNLKPINTIENQYNDEYKTGSMTMVLLTCDTISQAKIKILNNLYHSVPFSRQLKPYQFDLGIATLNQGIELLSEFNDSLETPVFCCLPMRLNQIGDFNIQNNSTLFLIRTKFKPYESIMSESRERKCFDKIHLGDSSEKRSNPTPKEGRGDEYGPSSTSSGFCSGYEQIPLTSLLSARRDQTSEMYRVSGLHSDVHWYHLENSEEIESLIKEYKDRHQNQYSYSSSFKKSRRIHLGEEDAQLKRKRKKSDKMKKRLNFCCTFPSKTRYDNYKLPIQYYGLILKETKNKIVPYLDSLMDKIFNITDNLNKCDQASSGGEAYLVHSLKYIFNIFDAIAIQNFPNQNDSISKAWKMNCMQLLLWNQILMNPDYILDIELVRETAFSNSFHTICQIISYASVKEDQILRRLTPYESSTVKNIYIQEILNYSKKISSFINKIDEMTPLSNEHFRDLLQQQNAAHKNTFDKRWLLYKFYLYFLKPKKHLILEGKLKNNYVIDKVDEFQRLSEILDSYYEFL